MNEIEIKRDCAITWAMNRGSFTPDTDKFERPDRLNLKNRVRRHNNNRIQRSKDKKSIIRTPMAPCVAKESIGGRMNTTAKIAKNMEAGEILSRVDELDEDAHLFVLLAYKERESSPFDEGTYLKSEEWLNKNKENTYKVKERSYQEKYPLLAKLVKNVYAAYVETLDEKTIKKKTKKTLASICLLEVHSKLNQYDKRIQQIPSKNLFTNYKEPKQAKKYYKPHIIKIREIIREIEIRTFDILN